MATTFSLGAESNRLPACLSVCLSRSSFKLLLLFFSMESSHSLAISSPCGTLQNCFSSIFDLGSLTPKIDSPKFGTKSPVSRHVWKIDWRCLGLLGSFRGWPIQWNHRKYCGADPCCHGNEILANLGIFLHKISYKLACTPDTPDGPTRGGGRTGRPNLVSVATTSALGAESNRLPACSPTSNLEIFDWRYLHNELCDSLHVWF